MRIGGIEKCTFIDYPGFISAVLFTVGCNFRCPYCHNPELVEETVEEITIDNIWSFLKSRQGILDGVTITGGEPTLHDDLPCFIKKIKDLGFLVKLDTNGTNPDMLHELYMASLLDYVAMDIKAPFSTYEQTVSRPIDVSKLISSVNYIMNSGISYEFRTTAIKSLLSIDDFHEIGNSIKGASVYYLQKFIPTKLLNPAFRRKTVFTEDEFNVIQKIMMEYVDTCYIR